MLRKSISWSTWPAIWLFQKKLYHLLWGVSCRRCQGFWCQHHVQIIHAMVVCFHDGRALGVGFEVQSSFVEQGDHGQSALHPWNFGSAAARWESEGGVVYLKLGESLDQQLNGQWSVGKERAIKNYGYEGMEGWFSGSAKGFDLLWNKFNSNGRGSQKIKPSWRHFLIRQRTASIQAFFFFQHLSG